MGNGGEVEGASFEHVALDLVLLTPSWIARRVDQIEMLDDRTILRKTSIDFTAPVELPFVPLGLVAKKPLESFDVRDEEGRALLLQTKAEYDPFATQLLLDAFHRLMGGPPSEGVAALLRRIATGSAAVGLDALDTIASKIDADSELASLRDAPGLQALFRQLATNFILCVSLPVPAGKRRLIKLSFTETRPPFPDWLDRPRGSHAGHLSFELPGATDARSYHVEIRAPAGLLVGQAELFFRTATGIRRVGDAADWDQLVHLYRPREKPTDAFGSVVTGESAWLRLRLEQDARGLLGPALMSVLGVTALLGFVVWKLDWFQVAEPDAAAALLLIIPAGASVFAGRPGEHDLARRMFRRTRLLPFALGIVVYIVAGLLVLVPHDRYAAYPPWLSRVALPLAALAGVAGSVSLLWLWVARQHRRRTAFKGRT